MNITRVRAEDMHKAMESISKEYGSDAILLNTQLVKKKGLANMFSKPYYEVVVGYDPSKIPSAVRNSRLPGAKAAGLSGKKPAVPVETAAVLSAPLPAFGDRRFPLPPEIGEFANRLVDCRVAGSYALSVAKEAARFLEQGEEKDLRAAFARAMRNRLIEPAPDAGKKKTVLFAGLAGAGKTTSLLKLAAEYSGQSLKVGIVNADACRIAACEQLKLYADMMEIPLVTIYDADELEQALAALADRDVVLIDTAGKRPGDPASRAAMEKMAALAGGEILLTISAQTSFSACREIMDGYAFLGDYRLLITKTDETALHGNLLNMCIYSGKALSFLTMGQSIPGDIEPACKEKIIRGILDECRVR